MDVFNNDLLIGRGNVVIAVRGVNEPTLNVNEPKPEKNVEPKEQILSNPARVTPLQLNHISFTVNDRFVPLQSHSSKSFGILILKDNQPSQNIEYVESGPVSNEQAVEVPLPKHFEYIED